MPTEPMTKERELRLQRKLGQNIDISREDVRDLLAALTATEQRAEAAEKALAEALRELEGAHVTIQTLQDKPTVKALLQGMQDIRDGKTVPLEQLMVDLDRGELEDFEGSKN